MSCQNVSLARGAKLVYGDTYGINWISVCPERSREKRRNVATSSDTVIQYGPQYTLTYKACFTLVPSTSKCTA